MQAELLRVVQEGTYKRVGSDSWRTTRFRLVCATNRDWMWRWPRAGSVWICITGWRRTWSACRRCGSGPVT